MPVKFLVTTARSLFLHKIQALINLTSLSIGLTVFGFTWIYVKQELSFDRSWPDADRIHRLIVEQHGVQGRPDGVLNKVTSTSYPQILDYFPSQIEESTRLVTFPGTIKDSSTSVMRDVAFVDPGFTDIFRLEVVAGDLARTLSGPGFIALEQDYAATLGADVLPGKRITVESIRGVQLEYEVGAIYRLPDNISPTLDFHLLTSMHDYSLPLFSDVRALVSWENQTQVWLKLKQGIDTDTFNAMQRTFVDTLKNNVDLALGPQKGIQDQIVYRWQPVTEMHFNPVDVEVGSATGDRARVVTFAVVGLLVLLVGCSNSINLNLARALEKRREVGLRKTMGAEPKDIFRQHTAESIIMALLALIMAIAMFEQLLPVFANQLPFAFNIKTDWDDYVLLAIVACIVGVASGAYPALVLSAVVPGDVIKVGSRGTDKAGLRTLLVGSQFGLASLLLIVTGALYLQLAVSRSQPLGLNAENLLALTLGSEQERSHASALRAELGKIPGVVMVVPAYARINANTPASSTVVPLVRRTGDVDQIFPQSLFVDPDFFAILEIPLLAGRTYNSLGDMNNRQRRVNEAGSQQQEERAVVNRSTIRALGFANPEEAVEQVVFWRLSFNMAGQVAHRPIRIIGVIEDNMYASLRRRPEPEIYLNPSNSGGAPLLMLKYESSIEATLLERIQETAVAINGQHLQNVQFIQQQIDSAFLQEQNESRLLMICGALALLLACTGLYGLVTFMVERQVKEVGVRKVLGAGLGAILLLFIRRFTMPVAAASLIASPLAAYFVFRWIERFPYQIEKVWLLPLCLGVTMLVLLISIMTVGAVTFRAATVKPLQSLRYE
jgi:putative ABC transport system permease protein